VVFVNANLVPFRNSLLGLDKIYRVAVVLDAVHVVGHYNVHRIVPPEPAPVHIVGVVQPDRLRTGLGERCGKVQYIVGNRRTGPAVSSGIAVNVIVIGVRNPFNIV